MVVFGLLSSVFDYVTFGVLLFILHATVDQFRTGWYIESVISASLIVLVIRTQGPLFKSSPSKYLLFATLAVVAATIILPFVALGKLFGFVPITSTFILFTAIIVGIYIFLLAPFLFVIISSVGDAAMLGLVPAFIPWPVLMLPPDPYTMRLPVLAWNASS
jgi:magnesium-transporting ATPase (P-type)